MRDQKTFYLASTEGPRSGHPWKCDLMMRIVWGAKYTRDDGMLVSVSPPIPSGEYGSKKPIKELVIFSGHTDKSLFPMSDWPIFVYICVINTDNVKATGRAEESELTYWDKGVIGNIDQVSITQDYNA